MPVVITSGQESRWSDGYYLVPKGELMHGLALEFENRELKLAEGIAGMDDLVGELKGCRKEYGGSGVRWQTVGKHDDLAMALALAGWAMRRRPLPVDGAGMRRYKGAGLEY